MPIPLIEGQNTAPEFRAINSALLGCLPDSRRVIIPNATHVIQFDAPEAMASAVVAFLGR
jgi:pimeloyl-ACP methyl ester carboxylesterase